MAVTLATVTKRTNNMVSIKTDYYILLVLYFKWACYGDKGRCF